MLLLSNYFIFVWLVSRALIYLFLFRILNVKILDFSSNILYHDKYFEKFFAMDETFKIFNARSQTGAVIPSLFIK